MPYPIVPVNELSLHRIIFEEPVKPFASNDLQSAVFQGASFVKEAKNVHSDKILTLLEVIDQYANDSLSASQTLASNKFEKVCTAPLSITDNQLLTLKVEGYITGYGRSVAFTSKGKNALRDHYLKAENKIKAQKTKTGFDYKSALEEFRKSKGS